MRVYRFGIMAIGAALITACADSPTDVPLDMAAQFAKGGGNSFNEIFVFNGVELDGDGSSNDVIEAHVRITGGGANTACVYFADNYASTIGRYYAATWGSRDAQEVLTFCMDHLDDVVERDNSTRFNYQVYFDDVPLQAGLTGDISAHSKQNNGGGYSDCVFYSADGATYLGNYGGSVAFANQTSLRDWCIANFPNRTDR